ncbi:MAG TPA: SDR family oxidoreductase [Acidimicrobiales bacterium]|jgi:NAD(P)-dependent dehydrogenase (short-subunit alcohol dehydrogenase family)
MDLSGAAALVTGGASGIGRATVRQLAEAGARVAVLDRQDGSGPDLNRDNNPDDVALRISCDISDEAAVVEGVRRAHDALGGLTHAVLAAGVGGFGALLELEAAEWDRVMAVNLRGSFLCLREVAKAMVEGGRGGSVVAVSSISGFLADRSMSHYSVSKAGLAELVRVAARELGPFGIRVNAVAPGTTDTPMFAPTARLPGYAARVAERTALGGVGSAEAVAEAIVAVLAMSWVTGQIVAADGGVSLWSPIDPVESLGSPPGEPQ